MSEPTTIEKIENNVSETYKEAKTTVEETATATNTAVGDAVDSAKKTVSEVYEAGKETVNDAAKKVDEATAPEPEPKTTYETVKEAIFGKEGEKEVAK
mmetsp:Transcript_96936/g.273980  ORF Transcript_96936/g.273980 Transcript_96936/m.273980 type:complete len:98 (+) Transcript_96936:160-453(+)|eukprot:CAMPEP_0117547794 /NCGR_PEP_ID=MMETSP0784-20121206/47316_1 /TAXON_ID=39447 /ORGANISM="" /LENGTH=97 /DNA_ID=CAMNT_0005344727 /DNA_START=116 /DNA_END=409 /DNA_ORIENTATION=-